MGVVSKRNRGCLIIMYKLLSVSIAMLAGLLMTRPAKKLRLPSVTAYLVAGVLIGPYCLGRLGISGIGFPSMADVDQLSLLSDVALGFIAFSIGSEFRLTQLRKTGRQAFVIGIVQGVTAAACVDLALLAIAKLIPGVLSVPQAITLGAIATATAPAATLMVVRQYKAKGPLVDLLLPIVALDDAVGLVVFAVSFGAARAMNTGAFDMLSIFVQPLVEIVCSLLLGAVMGWFLTKIETLFNSNTNRLNMTIAFVLFTSALSMLRIPLGALTVSFSPLLVCMMLGTVFCNLCPLSEEIMQKSDRWTSPLFAAFFVISGAQLELGVFRSGVVVLIGVVYILTRSLGKYFGARVSAARMRCNETIRRNLGITLLPQAGVALGMCVTARQLGPEGDLIRNITLFAILIYELVGPLLTKQALMRAGEIQPMPEEVKNRRKTKLEHSEHMQKEHASADRRHAQVPEAHPGEAD